ncbi:MAG: single-stranded DNA-binding protein, partial [Proteobacteria bacterium]|nr:single-stranded DNA-binding protein [Pseudomonadota bacterium]
GPARGPQAAPARGAPAAPAPGGDNFDEDEIPF